jgi:hypothetical protein
VTRKVNSYNALKQRRGVFGDCPAEATTMGKQGVKVDFKLALKANSVDIPKLWDPERFQQWRLG